MARFIDEAHCEERARVNNPFGIFLHFADQVHLVSKCAAGTEIGKDDIARVRKERISEVVTIPRRSRNVEFHHREQAPQNVRQTVQFVFNEKFASASFDSLCRSKAAKR